MWEIVGTVLTALLALGNLIVGSKHWFERICRKPPQDTKDVLQLALDALIRIECDHSSANNLASCPVCHYYIGCSRGSNPHAEDCIVGRAMFALREALYPGHFFDFLHLRDTYHKEEVKDGNPQ